MSRFVQVTGTRGSLKWIQRVANNHVDLFDAELTRATGSTTQVEWLSPIESDDNAEYRDAAFLERLSLDHLKPALAQFWPKAGPQWDGLARTTDGRVLLVEAKAHIREMCSSGSQASSPVSAALIEATLAQTAEHLKAKPLAPWSTAFYQLANRLAHLYFLRRNGVDAHLVLLNFVGDTEMKGPSSPAEWEAAYLVAHYVLGLSNRHSLSRYVHHAYVDVAYLTEIASPAG